MDNLRYFWVGCKTGYISSANQTCPFKGNVGHTLFELDNEDLKYLYDKYSKKLKEEMEQNINEIKNMYQ